MESLLECSKRTVSKIIQRMQLSCFNCSWNECTGDLHHIRPLSKGGTDDHNNLTYLCPNCHRMAHANKLTAFKTLAEIVGDTWKTFYNITPRAKAHRVFSGKRRSEALAASRIALTQKRQNIAEARLEVFRASNIDRTKYGWIQEASTILGVRPQCVVRYLKRWAPNELQGVKLRPSNDQKARRLP